MRKAPPVADRVSWWFDFELDRRQLALLRVAFFAVLAIDAFLQISHAPRYNAGDFNVPHLGLLPLPTPSRGSMLAIDLTLTYLFAMAALGVATRVVVPLAAVLDGYAYFCSQLDSYQHHYLVTMLLICACFVPWHATTPRIKSWALRLFTVQLALLYFWAAFAKLDPLWFDGSTLDRQLKPAWIRDLLDSQARMAGVARLLVVGEAALAAAWLWPKAWKYALPLGLSFHVGVELAGFQIGQFSFVMLAIYTLMIPEPVAALPARLIDRLSNALPAWPARRHLIVGAAVLAVAELAGLVVWSALPFEVHLIVVVTLVAVAGSGFALRRHWSVGAAHAAACLLILVLATTTDQARDYHKYWAGSARRLGNTEEMRRGYLGLVAIEPDHGPANYYLGKLALDAGDLDRALDHFLRAQRGQPHTARGWVGEALVHLRRDDRDAARDALQRGLIAEPGDRQAADTLSAISAGRAPESPDGNDD